MSDDMATIAVVSFHAAWGDKQRNLDAMLHLIDEAGRRDVDILVFPEMALTSYDTEIDLPSRQTMQHREAETVPGPSSQAISSACRKYGMYVVFGLPMRDKTSGAVHISACICGPAGIIGTYSKIHLSDPEPHWATAGDAPFIFDSPWGPIGVGICYDTYCFPELMDYYVAKGCRLYLNPTAVSHNRGNQFMDVTLQSQTIREGIYIASSNLSGLDLTTDFWGGCSVLGPDRVPYNYFYHAGDPSASADPSDYGHLFVTAIDLSKATRYLYQPRLSLGHMYWRPNLYATWFADFIGSADAC